MPPEELAALVEELRAELRELRGRLELLEAGDAETRLVPAGFSYGEQAAQGSPLDTAGTQ